MPLHLSCHCGGVAYALDFTPTEIVACNCSICSKLGWLMCYTTRDHITALTPEDNEAVYRRTDIEATLEVHRCKVCGISTHWRALDPGYTRMGVNARLIDGLDLAALPRRYVDGARW
jgi:hypothetical protein